MSVLHSVLIPENQRRSLDELRDRLDLSSGDSKAKQSAYWIMLVLSAVIAISGVIGDSTATVIGAMIVAPLSIPILGVALGVTTGRRSVIVRSTVLLIAGVLLVVTLGFLFAQLLPNPSNVLTNSQVAGRTSPKLMDLTAALATGVVAAVAMTRRDVSDVLPGVAVAISLVPPLGVVGVCLGSDSPGLAVGALILFGSNVVALILTAMTVFTLAGYPGESPAPAGQKHRRTYTLLAAALIAVAVPMSVNSLNTLWAHQISDATRAWLGTGGQVQDVTLQSSTATITVLGPAVLPPTDDLQRSVDSLVPWHPRVVVVHVVGGRTEVER
ncbi:TIGR00341 family protein [Gordonia sp. (in: high G+C Gram-positive bacteria)]|uniref:TIGR00341 family protein n=1 Tax=Gordonia sp. (in: high G+C Gram-positive bacteria) TaxID=84139 RepID=UPI0016B82D61|nr:TIGR00341 family protein [Gordonia sp. (in: high G+C Gram-positive bacteria)]NLG46271.1 TIGR00341 family protein [Gordonia sp. (in: high G+C Gram-positive bacteria)]